MAGKPDYTPNEGTPVIHANFKGAIDSEYISPNLIPMDILKDCTNLTPFRKRGSLQQCPGHSEYFATYPTVPTGYKLIDQYSFQIDRDNTALNMVIYSNGTYTKIYIDKWWNPASTYSNYNPILTADAWITGWVELTESVSGTIKSASNYDLNLNLTGTVADDYYNGWFAVDTSLADTDYTKYNFITNFDFTAGTPNNYALTTQCKVDTWQDNDTVILYRFPISHFYKAKLPVYSDPMIADYYGAGTGFNAVPTAFISSGNELRIACGKSSRPLILEMIYKRKFFSYNSIGQPTGASPIKYDGFWFDFEQMPQVTKNSQVTSFVQSGSTMGTIAWYTEEGAWTSSDPGVGKTSLKFDYKGVGTFRVTFQEITSPSVTQVSWGEFGMQVDILDTDVLPAADVKELIEQFLELYGILSYFTLTAVDVTASIPGASPYTTAIFTNSLSSIGGEAGNNILASNLFAGAFVKTKTVSTLTSTDRYIFLVSLLVDGRDETILAHGTHSPYQTADKGFDIMFNCWFSRRFTNINIYNRKLGSTGTGFNPIVFQSNLYPYFYYLKKITENSETHYVDINEVPLKSCMFLDDAMKTTNGETVNEATAVNFTNGTNAYTFDGTNGYWYTVINKSNNKLDEDGLGLKFIINTNRYIDQDTTMNYTKSVFAGQTNGRYFLIGCKNDVEQDVFENDDIIIPNNYAVGVSQYGTFLRNNGVFAGIGDKDIIRAISNYRGYLTVVKDNNVYGLDVNTEDEIQYRVVDTMLGRGTTYVDGICETPYGIVIPTVDGVWLSNPDGITPLMDSSNCRLKLYKDNLLYAEKLSSLYYNKYNELMIFIGWRLESTVGTVVFVYNFQYKFWTVYEYPNIEILKSRYGTNKEPVLLINSGDGLSRKSIYINESSYQFLTASSATPNAILWKVITHELPYGSRLKNVNISWITYCFDYIASASTSKIKFEMYRQFKGLGSGSTVTSQSVTDAYGVVSGDYDVTLPSGTYDNQIRDLRLNPNFTNTVSLKIYNSGGFSLFNLNSFYLWMQTQNRILDLPS